MDGRNGGRPTGHSYLLPQIAATAAGRPRSAADYPAALLLIGDLELVADAPSRCETVPAMDTHVIVDPKGDLSEGMGSDPLVAAVAAKTPGVTKLLRRLDRMDIVTILVGETGRLRQLEGANSSGVNLIAPVTLQDLFLNAHIVLELQERSSLVR